VTVDVEAFLISGNDGTMLLAGSELALLAAAAAETALLAGVDVVTSFSWLSAMSEQKLASDDDEATHSSLLAVDALFRLLFANDSTS